MNIFFMIIKTITLLSICILFEMHCLMAGTYMQLWHFVANTAESGKHGYAVWTLVSATWPRITGLQAVNIFSKMQLVHVCTWECRYLSSQSNILEYMDIRSLSCQG